MCECVVRDLTENNKRLLLDDEHSTTQVPDQTLRLERQAAADCSIGMNVGGAMNSDGSGGSMDDEMMTKRRTVREQNQVLFILSWWRPNQPQTTTNVVCLLMLSLLSSGTSKRSCVEGWLSLRARAHEGCAEVTPQALLPF